MNRLFIDILTTLRAGGLFWRLSIRPNHDTEQRATCRGSSCHRGPEHFTDSGSPGK
jgi:hypothetical protein